MQALYPLAYDFFVLFIITSVVSIAIWLGRKISLDANASCVSPKHFFELSRFSKTDQKRILQAADRHAFSGWRFAAIPLAYAALISGSIALTRTFHSIGIFRDSIWVLACVPIIFAILGVWIENRLEIKRLRPFLNTEIKKYDHITLSSIETGNRGES